MAKQRTSITINPELHRLGKQMATDQHFDDFSNFVEHLIIDPNEYRVLAATSVFTAPVRQPTSNNSP